MTIEEAHKLLESHSRISNKIDGQHVTYLKVEVDLFIEASKLIAASEQREKDARIVEKFGENEVLTSSRFSRKGMLEAIGINCRVMKQILNQDSRQNIPSKKD